MKIVSVVGARPNIIKLAPIYKAIGTIKPGLVEEHVIVHTGQHYDYELSEIFFKEFNLPKPNFNLEVGSGTPGFQIGEMIKRIENIFLQYSNEFGLVLVYGDTNSTFAGALAARRSGISVAHIESGLRSFDRHMPEEINRILTDHISDYLFAPTLTAVKNLERENVFGKVIYTGDIAVEIVNDAIKFSEPLIMQELKLTPKSYILFTMHRAENTDSGNILDSIVSAFELLSELEEKRASGQEHAKMTIVFPIHPRTLNSFREKNLYNRLQKCKNLQLIQPVGYIDFIKLIQNAKKVITDSGGVQKEAYLLSVPCITIRKNTEWVETVDEGWNVLTETDAQRIVKAAREWTPAYESTDSLVAYRTSNDKKPIFGNGETSSIIANFISSLINSVQK